MYATANLYGRYQTETVATSSAVELIIMLYDGCIKQIKLGEIYYNDNNDIEASSNALIKAQNIIDELLRSLDTSFSLSKDLMKIYEYVLYELSMANMKKDFEAMDGVIAILSELREAWIAVKRSNLKAGIYDMAE